MFFTGKCFNVRGVSWCKSLRQVGGVCVTGVGSQLKLDHPLSKHNRTSLNDNAVGSGRIASEVNLSVEYWRVDLSARHIKDLDHDFPICYVSWKRDVHAARRRIGINFNG